MVGGGREVAKFLLASDVSLRKAIFCTYACLTPPLRHKKSHLSSVVVFSLTNTQSSGRFRLQESQFSNPDFSCFFL